MNLQFGLSPSQNRDTSIDTSSKQAYDTHEPSSVHYSSVHPISMALNTSFDYGRNMRDSLAAKRGELKQSLVSQSLDLQTLQELNERSIVLAGNMNNFASPGNNHATF